jgi:hypothetical protein
VFNTNPNGNCYIKTGSGGWVVSNNDLYGYESQSCSYGNFISGDPGFTSPPAGDGRASAVTAYTLTSSSPAFCQGVSIAPYDGGYDFNHVALPGSPIDAGALEKGAYIC